MSNNEEKLRREILGDAERRAERILVRARRDAAKTLQQVRTDHETLTTERLAAAEVEAENRYRALTAGITHEVRNRWLRQREEVIADLLSTALARIEDAAYPATDSEATTALQALLSEAFAGIGKTNIVIRAAGTHAAKLSSAVIAAAATVAWGSRGSVSISVVVDAALRPGLVVESADGRLLFDNTYATRLARMRPELRALVSTGPEQRQNDKQGND